MSDNKWTRNPTVAIDKVWHTFQINQNERKLYCKIQGIPENLKEKCLCCMSEYYLRGEYKYSRMGIVNIKDSVEDFRKFWTKFLEDNLSLVCLVDETAEFANAKIAGVNILYCGNYRNFIKTVKVSFI